nr:group II intron maturase-specific domain-containing protein [Anaeromonas gelatinilytica]
MGWTFRKFRNKLIIKPSKSSTKVLIRKISDIILKEGKALKQEDLIRRLNSIIIGWTNYNKHVVASRTFSYVNNTIYLLLERWAKHRHPNKNKWWRLNKYWHERNDKPWVFMTDRNHLINLKTIDIRRHPKLQISKNPFLDEKYFIKRRIRLQSLAVARNG